LLGHPLTDFVQINLPIDILIDSIFFNNILFGLSANGDFCFFTDQMEFAMLINVIFGAAGKSKKNRARQKQVRCISL
jgi:hypothetical protein